MKYISTRNRKQFYSVEEAIFVGLPEDNGLFVPEFIFEYPSAILEKLMSLPLNELAFHVLQPYFCPDIPIEKLKDICTDTFNFEIPLVKISDSIYSLELYHGPTHAFKDIGARFLARCINHFGEHKTKQQIKVLVATSGDTGSAVAQGFFGLPNVEVIILYPKDKVSDLQERQMTCLGENIKAYKVDGTFDDCQKLVKEAFLDKELRKQVILTSANSINIARFIPQSVYYYYAISQLNSRQKIAISVPSGNYGNLTAGLFSFLSGLKIDQFIASSNINKVVPEYLQTGNYLPRPSIQTLSNAMDVGNPSNFERMKYLFDSEYLFPQELLGYSFNDDQTRKIISEVKKELGYLLDPHGAVGYLGLKNFLDENPDFTGILLETAHPAKFKETVEDVIGEPIDLPEGLLRIEVKEKKFKEIGRDYEEFREVIGNRY